MNRSFVGKSLALLCIAALLLALPFAGSMPAAAEQEGTDFTYTVGEDGNITLDAYTGNASDPVIPAQIDGKDVTAIGDGCFQGMLCVEKVHIPEGIQRIGDYAFECCSALRKVYFPESLVSIGDGAFSGCALLTLADMRDGIESIGKGAFLYCSSLVSLDLPAALKEIGSFAFAGCESLFMARFAGNQVTALPDRLFYHCITLTRVILPNKVASVGDMVFAGCESLKTVYLENALEEAGESVFSGCSSLTNVEFPAPVIRENTFSDCGKLTGFTVSGNTTSIKAGAFNANAIKYVQLPSGITEIEEGAFAGSQVQEVYLDECENYQVTDGVLYGDGGRTLLAWFPADPYAEEPQESFTVPDGVEIIGAGAFFGSTLSTVILPESLKEIHSKAFIWTDIQQMKIPEGTVVAEDAFGTDEVPVFDPESGERTGSKPFKQPEPETEEPQTEAEKPEENLEEGLHSVAGDRSLFKAEDFADYRTVPNDEFDAWSEAYLEFNAQTLKNSMDYLPYVRMYKGEVISYYRGMSAVQTHDAQMEADSEKLFGKNYEEMFLMLNHGLFTELKRGRMPENMVLYTGVYDSQLKAAAGTEELPTLSQLADRIGTVYTDPVMISTTTDAAVACGFGDTVYIIYASAEALDAHGAISIDSIMHTRENEILLSGNAQLKILDAGRMAVPSGEPDGEVYYRDYLIVQLMAPGSN